MKLGLIWGYWGQLPPPNLLETTKLAEDLGFDSVWTAESWGSDAFSPLAYLAGHTSRIKLGTSVVQLSARTPTSTAMHALTIDHLSNGRLILGLGVSGPQVVEGWYGQPYRKPLKRTREYVDIVRQVLARDEPVTFDGEFYQHPYHGPNSTGLGKPLKSITHPLRRDIPIFLGAEGPKNVAMTAEIADGWFPLYYSPWRQDVYADQLAGAKDDFEVVALANINITDDVEAALEPVKMMLAFYIGGMGAKGQNFHTELMARMGFEEAAFKIQDLFFEGRRDEAIALVPDEFADEISLVGPPGRIKERLEVWKSSPVTTLTMYPSSPEQLRLAADLILD
jgi:F420-dependent oxidoreductase-like protein